MGEDENLRLLPEGARVAIVGAGPAGCLLAIALLDAAVARRQPLQVFLFHGGERRSGAMLIDPAALAGLSAAGLPPPDPAAVPLHGVRSIRGAAVAQSPLPIFAMARGDPSDLADSLREAARERGAQILLRTVDEIAPGGDGGWVVRASGASMRAETVVLACGAGAPIASRIEGHQPPPIWRCCAAALELAPDARDPGPWLNLVHGDGSLPDLWIVSAEGNDHALATGPNVTPAALAEALLAAVASGRIPPMRLRDPQRILLPAGAARPALPSIGDALGGSPLPWRLAAATSLSQRLAAAYFDGGPGRMLQICREEAIRLEPRTRRNLRQVQRWRRRPAPVVERALLREQAGGSSWQPVTRALASSAAPSSEAGGWLLAIRTLLALAVAWLLLAWAALRFGDRSEQQQTRWSAGRVFVVDDDADQAEAICEYLEGRGVPCVPFRDGMTAVAAAARELPAAVVLDVVLPWLDGPTICRALRRRGAPPVYLVTALPLALAKPEGHAAGATAVLSKPLDLPGLALRLQAHVRVGPPPAGRKLPALQPRRADAAQPPA